MPRKTNHSRKIWAEKVANQAIYVNRLIAGPYQHEFVEREIHKLAEFVQILGAINEQS
jgi:hypothetical protein